MVPPLSIEPVSSATAQMDSEPSGLQGEPRRSNNKRKDRNRKKSHSGSQPGDTGAATAVAEAPVEAAAELVNIEAASETSMVVTEMAVEPFVEPLGEPATPPTMEAVFVEPEDSNRQGWFSWPAILIVVAGAALLAYILFGGLFGPT
jgi:hypothetical protein